MIMPEVANDTMTYQEVMEEISRYDVDVKYPEVGDIFTLGDAEFHHPVSQAGTFKPG